MKASRAISDSPNLERGTLVKPHRPFWNGAVSRARYGETRSPQSADRPQEVR